MGLGPAGVSQARRLAEHGYEVVVTEEPPSDASRARAAELAPLGVTATTLSSVTEEALNKAKNTFKG